MEALDIIRKHLTPEVPFKLGDDIIYLKPLTIGEQVLCFKISKKTQKFNGNEIIELDEDTVKEMFDLFSSIIKRSIPNIDESTLENFVLTNFNELSLVLEKLIPNSENSEKLDIIKKRFEEQKKAKEEKK